MNPAQITALIGAATAAADLIGEAYKAISEARANNAISKEEADKWDAYVRQRITQPHWIKSTK